MKKIISLLSLLILVISCSVSNQDLAVEQEDSTSAKQISASVLTTPSSPVKLYSAKLYNTGVAWHTTFSGLTGYIEVQNLGEDKEVTVVFWDSYNEEWKNALYIEKVMSTNYNTEIWSFHDFSAPTHVNVKFAICYKVNGEEYWDNNNGNDYFLSDKDINISAYYFGNNNVLDFHYQNQHRSINYKYNDYYYGYVHVKNIAYTKEVKIVYTTDNWSTVQETFANYSSTVESPDNYEQWSFRIENIPASAQEVKYAIAYTVDGVTYWDNNFEKNYTITVEHEN